jgi:hypothetical protein
MMRLRKKRWFAATLCFRLCLAAPVSSDADAVRVTSAGVRGGLTGFTIIGDDEIESFQRYDVFADIGLPWSWFSESTLVLDTGLTTSVGALLGGGDVGLVGTLTPLLILRTQDRRFSVDFGVGGAVISRHEFGDQEWGGPFQLDITWGFRFPLHRSWHLGYRYQHLSDADIYGDPSRGADFHMLELIYRFP